MTERENAFVIRLTLWNREKVHLLCGTHSGEEKWKRSQGP